MEKRPSLVGASLRSSLSTIDIICESYGDHIGLLPKEESDAVRNLLSEIDRKVNSLTSKINSAGSSGHKDPKLLRDRSEDERNNSKDETEEMKRSEQPESDNNLLEERRHTVSCDHTLHEATALNDASDTERQPLESTTTAPVVVSENNNRPNNTLSPETVSDLERNELISQSSNIPSIFSTRKHPTSILSDRQSTLQKQKRRLSFPFGRTDHLPDSSPNTSAPIAKRQRNISILPISRPSFNRKSSTRRLSASSIFPALKDTPKDEHGGVTRRTLSRPVRPVLLEKKESAENDMDTMAKNAFRIIDFNNDGFLQREEVIAAIQKLKENGGMDDKIDAAEMADSMMKEVDVDGDGQIDIDEFTEMMKKSPIPGAPNGNMLSHNHRMSQLARNVLLAHQKKIENSVIGSDTWMIHPLSSFHAVWDIIVSLLILLTVVTMPLALGWEELSKMFYPMTLTVDFIFLIDVCKNFCTGFVDDNDAIIMDAKTVRANYLTGYFTTDLCSSIPLELILQTAGISSDTDTLSGTKHTLKMLKLLKLTKFFRLLRISRLFKHIKRVALMIEEILHIRISDGFTKLLKIGLGALVLGHWIGCFNFMLVRFHDFPEDSWVVFAGLTDKDPFTQWSWSFFKALAQMIMIGFETPPFTNASCDVATYWCGIEHWTTLGCLYLGAVFYSLLISSISSILQTASLASRQFEEKLVQIDDYMRTKKLPATLREKVKDHFHIQHSDGKLFNEDEILGTVTPILRREIKFFNGRDISVKVPLLSSVINRSFSEEMTTIIEPTIAFTDEVILRENTTGEDMFFISSGVVEIFLAGAQNSAYVAIGDGCYFGEVSLLLGIRRTASARTKTQCLLYKITKENLIKVLTDYPEINASMKKVATSRKNRLAHYVNPKSCALSSDEEIDAEDCKTELFGVDADEVALEKEEAFEKSRRHANFGKKKHPYRETIKGAQTNSNTHLI